MLLETEILIREGRGDQRWLACLDALADEAPLAGSSKKAEVAGGVPRPVADRWLEPSGVSGIDASRDWRIGAKRFPLG